MVISPVTLPPSSVADLSGWTPSHQRAWELVRQWEQAAQPYLSGFRLWDFTTSGRTGQRVARDPSTVHVFKQVFLRLDTYAATLGSSSEELITAFWLVFGSKPRFVYKLRPNWMLNPTRAKSVLVDWRADLAQRGMTTPAKEEEVRGYVIMSATAPLRDRARASVKYGYDRAADMVWMGKLNEKFNDKWYTLSPEASPQGEGWRGHIVTWHTRQWFDPLLGMLWLHGPSFGKEWLWGLGPVWPVPPEIEQAAQEAYAAAESLAGKDADPVRYWGRSVLVEWHREFVGVIERSINHRMPRDFTCEHCKSLATSGSLTPSR